MFDDDYLSDIDHISIAKKADLFIVMPATYNIVGKVSSGIADDLLSTTISATRSDVLFALAMNTNMYENKILKRNIKTLEELGYKFIHPRSGKLACGDEGVGKLEDENIILEYIIDYFTNKDLLGKKILITAGATKEYIDPVRYITNPSTGKMGYFLALNAKRRGADVVFISANENIKVDGAKNIYVKNNMDMYSSVMDEYKDCDIIIKAAAVSDFTHKNYYDKKIKKSDDDLVIDLKRTKDILLEVSKLKEDRFLVGFAAETDDVVENAKKKLKKKNLDMIVANDIKKEGAGFSCDTNIISIITKNSVENFNIMTKDEVSNIILNKIINTYEIS